MGFFSNLFGGGPQKFEDKGDELRLDLQYRDAAFYYTKALDAIREEDPALRGRIETKLREVRRKAVAELIEEAVELMGEGDLNLAEERLDTAGSFADDPTTQREVERRLEEIHDLRGERAPQVEVDIPEEVAGTEDDLFELSLSGLEPGDRERAAELGEPFRMAYEACQREDWAAGRSLLQGILEEHPDEILVLELAAFAAEQSHNDEEALDFYRRAHDADPLRPGPVQGLVAALRGRGEDDDATAILEEAVAAMPPDGAFSEPWVEIHVDRAMGLAQAGRFDDSIHALQALATEPAMNQALLCFNMAGVLEAADREEECRGALEKAVELAPRTSVYRERLSDFLVKRGVELDLALGLLVQANEVETTAAGGMFGGGGSKAQISPHRARYLYKMARVYYLKGEDLEAERTITTALAVATEPEIRSALDDLREELKQPRA